MADPATNNISIQPAAQVQNPAVIQAPDPKTNWTKDLAIPVLTAILGFVFGVTQDILKHEYEYRSNTPRVRYIEKIQAVNTVQSQYSQEASTVVYPVGRAVIPTLVIRATAANEDIHLVDDEASSEPTGQKALLSQMETVGRTDRVRSLVISNFHEPQRVTWTLKATSPAETTSPFVEFDYSGTNDIHNDNNLRWTEKVSPITVASFLLVYSAIATALAFYFRWKGR